MTFDSIVMAAVADELNRRLADGRVDDIYQPAPLDVTLTIRAGGANHILLVSAEAESPRIHFTSVKRPNPQTPPNFCMLMRKYLKGARFVHARQMDFDRVLHLTFSAYDGEPLTLVVEIMGKHSNVILINAAGRILGTIKPVGRTKSRFREVLPGREYVAPPSQNRADPLSTTKDDLSQMLEGISLADEAQIASWLAKSFTGISPFAAREIAARAQGEAPKLPDVFDDLFSRVRSGDFEPVLISNDTGQTVGYYAFPSVQFARENQHARTTISTVADVYYNTELPKHAFEDAKDDLVNRLRKELEHREQAIESIREQIAECEDAERYKQLGELILSQTASIPPKAETADLVDYYDPEGATVTVDLDPTLSAAENAEAYFRQYHKAITGADALRDRLAETEADARSIRDALELAESADSKERVEELLVSLGESGIRVRKPDEQAQKKKEAEFDGHRIQRIESAGWEILIGLNSDANDYLLTRVARPSDIWLHVKASPSSHVIIRTNGKPDSVPRQILEQAAELTARHSDQKHSSLVPVDYTQRRYVRKPKGAPAGKALYTHEKTVFITPGA